MQTTITTDKTSDFQYIETNRPITISGINGEVRGIKSRIEAIRSNVKKQNSDGNCTHTGWGD